MTAYFLSINKGASGSQLNNVAIATSAPSADMYLQIDATTHTPDRLDVILALKSFMMYIQSNGVPKGQIGTDLPNN